MSSNLQISIVSLPSFVKFLCWLLNIDLRWMLQGIHGLLFWLRSIHHLWLRLVRDLGRPCSDFSLFLLLYQGTAHAAIGDQTIGAAIRLDAVFRPHATARNALKEALAAAKREQTPTHALRWPQSFTSKGFQRGRDTYAAIATPWICLFRLILSSLCFSVEDTRAPPRQAALNTR